ncbi:MAG: ribosomal protein L13e [Nitrososphaerales archaeon]
MSAKDKKTKPKGKKAPTRKAPAPKVQKTKKAPAEEKPKRAAPKAKKVTEKKEAPSKVSVKAEPVVLGPPPGATIASRHIDSVHERPGRGFSYGELASAGVPLNTARREGLSLDVRRRSVLEGNVESLKSWLKNSVKTTEAAAGK